MLAPLLSGQGIGRDIEPRVADDVILTEVAKRDLEEKVDEEKRDWLVSTWRLILRLVR